MVVISRFSENELGPAYSIFKAGHINSWSIETFKKSALNGISLVAKSKQSILGYILLSSVLDEMTIEDITVDLAQRGKGVGRQLIAAAFEKAVLLEQAFIFLEVRESNKSAIQLYLSSGFEQIGQRKDYYEAEFNPEQLKSQDVTSAPRENALIMKKVLSSLSSN